MDPHHVIITPDAEQDLTELRDYISYVLLVPDTASNYLQTLRKAISKLSYQAGIHAPIPDEPWHSRGVRKIAAKNFYIYYRIDEDASRVYVLNVIYARRDQLNMLRRMKME
ncbi:type II toxin-antitoxin system RelE/ParE family toxin [Arcanobacterium phocisimile]|uniref:Type II toxin-antitoxin system RelE/ParE family toxin n=1 Tax=Arcanobacterium phocisimile TaxID=1302235 RepID=A0ABX7IHN2_9ACTO|nr:MULTISPECIES: type II toxin-antitoxin system RelE/ParE family toxin [Arcanobacterium]QRV02644.1 type II toxin-antitoxin system RelE/ParE family toxin [Arcanobacterium phocisimile]